MRPHSLGTLTQRTADIREIKVPLLAPVQRRDLLNTGGRGRYREPKRKLSPIASDGVVRLAVGPQAILLSRQLPRARPCSRQQRPPLFHEPICRMPEQVIEQCSVRLGLYLGNI